MTLDLLMRTAQKWLFLHFFQMTRSQRQRAFARNPVFLCGEDEVMRKTANSVTRMQALGRLKAGKMNKTEQAYDRYLGALKAAGEILWYRFEGIKFRLADNTFYTPDFSVMRADGLLEQHEVKGFWTDDARVKIKVAAEQFPVRFVAVKKKGSGWEREYFD
ncbi:DUF1064 domain-containing protein [Pseudomonas neustonica]|uniref:hypothetical protein n=1 Tax=Pseudomonas neustonica TaxID=2487346 RepID=UPI003F6E0718